MDTCESLFLQVVLMMATGRSLSATQPPTIWLPPGRCFSVLPFMNTHTHHTHSVYIHILGTQLPLTWLSLSITSALHPALLPPGDQPKWRLWPNFKASLYSLDINTAGVFEHFLASWNAFFTYGDSLALNISTGLPSGKLQSALIHQLWNWQQKSHLCYHCCNHNQFVPHFEYCCMMSEYRMNRHWMQHSFIPWQP